MRFLPELIALLVILAFVGLLVLAIRTSRRQAAEKKHLALTLGFEEVITRPSRLISRAESVYKKGENQSILIDNVYTKKDWGQEFFLFDINDSNKENGDMGSEVFGVITSQLDLPHFSLTTLPGFNSGSLIGGLMEGLMDKVLSMADKYLGMTRIELPNWPDMDEQVIIFGKDQEAVREMLERIDLRSITTIKTPVHITGMDDFLAMDFTNMGPLNEQEYDLITQHQEFTRILNYFTK